MRKSWILLALFLISLTVRILFMNDGLFHHDSIQMAWATERTIETGQLQPTTHGRYGLVLINALAYWPQYLFWGTQSAGPTITFVTIILSALAVCALFLFTKELTQNNFIAISAALLLSLNPLFLSVTTYAKSNGPGILFILLSGYLLLLALRRGSNNLLLWAGVVFVYSLLVRFDNILFIVPFALLYLFPWKLLEGYHEYNKPKLKYLAIPFLALAMFALFSQEAFNITTQEMQIPFKDLSQLGGILFKSLGGLVQALTPPVMVVVILSYLYFAWKHNPNSHFLLLWFLAIFLPLGLTVVANPRLYVAGLIPLLILAAMGLNEVYERRKGIAVVLLLFLVLFSFASIYPVIKYRNEQSLPMELAYFVDNLMVPRFVLIAKDNSVFFNYYSNITTMDYDSNVIENIKLLHSSNTSVYILSRTFDIVDTSELNSHFSLVYIGETLTEDYHNSELDLNIKKIKLYQINPTLTEHQSQPE